MSKTIIAHYTISNSFGLVMYEISDERVTVAWSDELEKTHTRKLYYAKRGPYFILNDTRYYLDEFMRV
ncbi:hypothetical protein D1872_90210 [compost metagenome]